jgi:hypothetical protein
MPHALDSTDMPKFSLQPNGRQRPLKRYQLLNLQGRRARVAMAQSKFVRAERGLLAWRQRGAQIRG